jgi:hypothetical protein
VYVLRYQLILSISLQTDDSQICQPISSKKNAKLANSSSAEAMSTTEDKQIRVSVYIRLMKKKVTGKRQFDYFFFSN